MVLKLNGYKMSKFKMGVGKGRGRRLREKEKGVHLSNDPSLLHSQAWG